MERDGPVLCPPDQVGLVLGGQVHCADIVDVGLFPGVDGLADKREGLNSVGGNAEHTCGFGPELGKVRVEGEREVADSYHVITLQIVYHREDRVTRKRRVPFVRSLEGAKQPRLHHIVFA